MDDEWKRVYDIRAEKDIPDHGKGCWTKEGFEELMLLTSKFVDDIAKISHVESILDVGSGPGTYCNMLYLKGYSVTGVDYSENMVKLSKDRYPSIPFFVGNGYALDFPDASFDLVISIGVLQCLMDHERFLKEVSRVARRFIIISTLWRDDDGRDPQIILKKQLMEDSWPTREYNPSEILPLLESRGFSCSIIKENDGKAIKDGYFIIAKRNEDHNS